MSKLKLLTQIANERMEQSTDPVHDAAHIHRVIVFAKIFAKEAKLNQQERQALILAASWHDVSRTITKNPSMMWMPFFDDILSALMLWRETIRQGMFGSSVGLATRIILCKSLGTGAVFTKLFLRKKHHQLLDMIKDADTLDVLDIDRMKHVYSLADMSFKYHLGYKLSIWWFLTGKQLYMKTDVAKKYVLQAMKEFLAWIQEAEILAWHVVHYGEKWVKKNLQRCEILITLLETELFLSVHTVS